MGRDETNSPWDLTTSLDDSNHAATSSCTKCTELLVRRSKFLSGNINNPCEYVLPPTRCCKEQVINVEQGVCAVPPAPFPSAEEDECPLNIFFLRKKNHLHPSKINQIQHKKSSKSMNKTHRIHENSQPS